MLASKYAEPGALEVEPKPAKRESLVNLDFPSGNMVASKYADTKEPEMEEAAAVPASHPKNPENVISTSAATSSASELPTNSLQIGAISEISPAAVRSPETVTSPIRPPPLMRKLTTKRGKTCPIKVPGDTSNRIPPLNPLSEADVNARFEKFRDAGFIVLGYGNYRESISRDEYPDPKDIQYEREQRNFKICVPDQAKWEAYQNELTEQKLLALGVTSGDEDTTPSLSRQVSQSYPPLPISPPIPSASAASQHLWQTAASFGSTFSPGPPISNTSFTGSLASFGPMSRNSSMSNQSPFDFQFPRNQAASPMHQMWSPHQAIGQHGIPRGGSPAMAAAGLQNFASMLSPSPDHLSHGFQRGSNPPPWQFRDQMQRPSSVTQASDPSYLNEKSQSAEKISDPLKDDDSASHWFVDPDQDIAYPTPRGHKHNISETLERDLVEQGEYYPGEYVDKTPTENTKRKSLSDIQSSNDAQTESSAHKAAPSLASNASASKLNVEAPEFKFDAKASHFRNLSLMQDMFVPNTQQPTLSAEAPSFLPASVDKGLNVAAPAFKPGMKEFPFSSSSFNFTAERPASTPSRSLGSTPMSSVQKPSSLYAGTPSSEAGRIFSQIDFSDIVKQPRTSKAVPIVPPEPSDDSEEDEEESDLEDESGRIIQSDARQKRARRGESDGDMVPLFAPSPVNPEGKADLTQQESAKSNVDKLELNPSHELIDMRDQPIDEDMDDLESKSRLSSRRSSPSPTLPELSADVQSPSQADDPASDPIGSPSFQEIDAIMEFINSEEPDMIQSPVTRKPLSPTRGLPLDTSSPLQEAQLPSEESDVTDLNVLRHNILPQGKPANSWTVPDDLSVKERTLRAAHSPVQKLNSPGKLPTSDWDDVVSSTEEGKFQERAQTLGTPMTTLIESMLKKLLIPLEKKLTEMGEFTRVPLRELSGDQGTRISLKSEEKLNSDADDEDDPDELSRNRPTSRKMDKKTELIKAAVLEAITGSQNPTMHKIEEELSLRYAAERREADMQRLLKLAEEELELYRKATEDTDNKIRAMENERRDAHRRIASLENTSESFNSNKLELEEEITALRSTLDEYRISSSKWREEIDEAHVEKKSLQGTIDSLKSQNHQHVSDREAMVAKIKMIQEDMQLAVSHSTDERAIWQRKDQEHAKMHDILSAKLEGSSKNRERLEQEVEKLQAQHHESIKTAVILKETQNANARLETAIKKFTEENLEYQKAAAQLQIEASTAKENAINEIHRNKMLLEAEVEVANKRTESLRVEYDSRLETIRNELNTARNDAETAKETFKRTNEEVGASRAATIREAAQSSSATLQEERRKFEKQIADLTSEHGRALSNTQEDKKHSEARLQSMIDISNEKVQLLMDKIRHLEDKVSVAQAAAQAAASAAQSAKAPNFSPQSYEKVSPKALRETIAALQEQLHDREARIEYLEQQGPDMGINTPARMTEQETEIGWLRELLGLRIDDLSELVDTLSQPTFNPTTVRNAAIRIRSSLQMELHEKERVMAGGTPRASIPIPTLADIQNFSTPTLAEIQNFASPKIAGIQNYASPKAAQIAAAWGNWRKGKEPAYSALAQVVTGRVDESPPKPSPTAQNFVSGLGLATPPASNLRKSMSVSADDGSQQPQSPNEPKTPTGIIVSGRRRESFPPKTPPLMRKASYDQDASMSTDPYLDEDDSTIDGNPGDRVEILPFGPDLTK